jgi:hypothetical protein
VDNRQDETPINAGLLAPQRINEDECLADALSAISILRANDFNELARKLANLLRRFATGRSYFKLVGRALGKRLAIGGARVALHFFDRLPATECHDLMIRAAGVSQPRCSGL